MVDIVALDPGLTIGITTVTNRYSYRHNQLTPANFPHPHETLFDLLSSLQPKKIIYERFDFRAAKNGVVLKGVEFIGVIELYAQLKCIECTAISPSTGKAFWNNDKLKALGVYRPGMPHANDATRLALTHQMADDEVFKEWALEKLRAAL